MKLLLILLATLSPILAVADEKIVIDRQKLIEKGKRLSAADFSTSIPDEIKKEAENLFTVIQNKIIPETKQYAETITFDNETGVMKFDRVNIKTDNKTDVNLNALLNSDERIYIFISSSIPKHIISKYAEDVEAMGLGKNIIFVLRGCIDSGKGLGGCGDYKPTMDFIKSFTFNKKQTIRNVQMWIDPILFNKYQITEVPTFVYNESVKMKGDIGSEGDDSNLISSSLFYKSSGDWSLNYHLRELENQSGAVTLKAINERYINEKND